MDAVLSQLAAIAKERRERKPLPLHAVSRETTVGDDAVRKFESGQQGQNIDRMANAYADALGVSVFDLWDEAISRARNASKPAATPSKAAQALLEEQEAEREESELDREVDDDGPQSDSSEQRGEEDEPESGNS